MMLRTRVRTDLAAVVLGLTTCTACKQEPSKALSEVPREPGFIAFVGASETDPVWPLLRASAERFDRTQNRIEVRYLAPDTATPDRQVRLVRDLVGPKLRGLCIQPLDAAALRPVLDSVRRRGAPIVTMLRPVDEFDVEGYVGVDESAAGRELAAATARLLGGKGHIMVIQAGDGDPAMKARQEAFRDAIRDATGIEVWASIDCGGDPAAARSELVARSARFPSISAWVSLAPWPLFDTSASDEALPAGLRLVTCGAEPRLWPFIESGVCAAVVAFDYQDAGARALEFCLQATTADHPTLRRYTLPIRVVTPADLAAYRKAWGAWASSATTTSASASP